MFDPKITRQTSNILSYEKRKNNFDNVDSGFGDIEAKLEAKRCLSCLNPSCQKGCPLNLPIRDMIALINNDNINEASKLINRISPFTYLCSIVCDHQKQCEGNCIRNKNGQPVSIGNLHRYICEHSNPTIEKPLKLNNYKIAVIGGGPAGIAAAYKLYLKGYMVTIFEKENNIGGVPYYSIPSFRLNNTQLKNNYDILNNTNIKFCLNKPVSVNEIKDSFDAVLLTIGTQISINPKIPGSNLEGVITSDEFLKDIKQFNNIEKYKQYTNAYIIGCGNVALDCARTLIRIIPNVNIAYRRSINEAPGRKDEIKDAELEGIKLHFLINPLSYKGNNKLNKIEFIKMELGEKDASGRASFKEIDGSNYLVDADLVILALSSKVDNQYLDGLNLNKNGLVIVNENQQTSIDKVFAAGDVVTGPNTVVHAIRDALKSADNIDKYLHNILNK